MGPGRAVPRREDRPGEPLPAAVLGPRAPRWRALPGLLPRRAVHRVPRPSEARRAADPRAPHRAPPARGLCVGGGVSETAGVLLPAASAPARVHGGRGAGGRCGSGVLQVTLAEGGVAA